MAKEILDVMLAMRNKKQPYALATVVETIGSVSARIGAKAVIDEHGTLVAGWVGGGCAESITCHAALESIIFAKASVIDIDMDGDTLGEGMPCGGSIRVYIEPVLPKPELWILGHGRVAECLCQIGSLVGLEVVVSDPEVNRDNFVTASRLITNDRDLNQLTPAMGDYVVIATQSKSDHESLKRVLASEVDYIALIASRKRARLVMEYLRDQGFDEHELQRVKAPAGIDLGAKLPEEIALCVISEIVMERRGGSGARMQNQHLAVKRQSVLKS